MIYLCRPLECFINHLEGSFEHSKHMLKLMGKKIITILHSKNVYLELCLQVDYSVIRICRFPASNGFHLLTHKAPPTIYTKFCCFFKNNQKGMIFHENCLLADNSHEISYLFFTCVALAKAGLVVGPLRPSVRLSVRLSETL